ncbi:alpha/beta hydrolase [Thalassotalea ganghwensis]
MRKVIPVIIVAAFTAGLIACGDNVTANDDKPSASMNMETSTSYNQELIGRWVGTLPVNESHSLEMTLSLKQEEQSVAAIMDVPSQGQLGIRFDKVNLLDNQVKIALTAAGITIEGTLQNGKIVAQYQQGGFSAPIEFTPNATVAKRQPKPQELGGKDEYQVVDVSFENKLAGHKLSGTLTIPNGSVKHAAIILSGSGPSTRDGDVFGHKVYKVLADQLTKHGIAVLRYDDRGVGESTGDFASATSADFATDANAALEFLNNYDALKDTKIGFIGHSEGGLIAAIALTIQSAQTADFFVSLAGPGTPGQQLMVDQLQMILKQQNVPEDAYQQASGQQKQIMAAIANDTAKETLFELLLEMGMQEQQAQGEAAQLTSKWMRYFVKSDIQQYLRQLNIPVLALNGAKDVQVPAKQNIDGFIASVDEKWLDYKIYPELNHLFQPAKTGLPAEYGKSEITISDQVAEDIFGWLSAL